MSVSQTIANDMLAEFLAQRAVTVCKARAKGMRLVSKPDKIERVEFEPDNSRIGCQSRGLQSMSKVSVMFRSSVMVKAFPDAIAREMVSEYLTLKQGFLPMGYVGTVVNIDTDEIVNSDKQARPVNFGERVSLCHVPVKSLNQSKENVLCQNRMKPSPRQGQRPVVLTSKNSLK